jgi:putative ABC transport system permease protein
MAQMPIRNLLRRPRRAVLTALGVGAAITALVAVLGMPETAGTKLNESEAG